MTSKRNQVRIRQTANLIEKQTEEIGGDTDSLHLHKHINTHYTSCWTAEKMKKARGLSHISSLSHLNGNTSLFYLLKNIGEYCQKLLIAFLLMCVIIKQTATRIECVSPLCVGPDQGQRCKYVHYRVAC